MWLLMMFQSPRVSTWLDWEAVKLAFQQVSGQPGQAQSLVTQRISHCCSKRGIRDELTVYTICLWGSTIWLLLVLLLLLLLHLLPSEHLLLMKLLALLLHIRLLLDRSEDSMQLYILSIIFAGTLGFHLLIFL